MFLERKRVVETQMAELQETLDFINHRCWHYETALEAGTEKIHFAADSDDAAALLREPDPACP